MTIDGADNQEPSGNFDKTNEISQTSTQINNVSNNFTLDNLFILFPYLSLIIYYKKKN